MMHRLGANRIIVVGVPPLGCIPLVKTLNGENKCVEKMNKVSYTFNAKLLHQISTLKAKFNLKTAYVDAYGSILNAVMDPKNHGQYIFTYSHLHYIQEYDMYILVTC